MKTLLALLLLVATAPAAHAGKTCFIKGKWSSYMHAIQRFNEIEFYEGTKLEGTISPEQVFQSARMNLGPGKSCKEIYAEGPGIFELCQGLCKGSPTQPIEVAPAPRERHSSCVLGTQVIKRGQCYICAESGSRFELYIGNQQQHRDGVYQMPTHDLRRMRQYFDRFVNDGYCGTSPDDEGGNLEETSSSSAE